MNIESIILFTNIILVLNVKLLQLQHPHHVNGNDVFTALFHWSLTLHWIFIYAKSIETMIHLHCRCRLFIYVHLHPPEVHTGIFVRVLLSPKICWFLAWMVSFVTFHNVLCGMVQAKVFLFGKFLHCEKKLQNSPYFEERKSLVFER
jgi:hypothetical protein